jgi:3-oxoacyl-[acyl-carrier protein] reductase
VARVVVVSGGGTGIGRAVAARFAADGDQVVIVGRRPAPLEEAAAALGGSVLPVAADLVTPEGAALVAETVGQRYGRVDVLVANAGGNTDLGADRADLLGRSGLALTAAAWTANFRANVLTAVLLTEALDALLTEGGRVLLLSSIAAYRGSGSGSYGSVKAALHPYAVDLAGALGGRGITVNVVAPGFTDDTEFFAGRMTDERRRTLVGQTLTGRVGTVDDVAATVHWLASPAAGHVTAQVIQVNGGALPGR